MKKIISVIGARPQFIKCAALSPALRKHFKEVIVHTGQHYDENMSGSFFRELDIPFPDYNLEVGSDTPGRQIGNMMIRFEEVVEKEKPDLVIVFGDTNSTAAASIVAVKHGIKLAHVEAGLREFNKYIPEESNKLITDILTDFYFCPTDTAVNILKSMGINEDVYNVGDVMIDIIEKFRSQIENNINILNNLNVEKGKYVFVTCHRAANTDNIENLRAILSALGRINKKIIFPLHPRTNKVIKENGLENMLGNSDIQVIEPTGYFDSQTLIMYSDFVITDSGGVTKEAYYHKVPGILVDTQTEWVETIKEGWNHQAGPNEDKITDIAGRIQRPALHSNCLGDGKASEKIAAILLKVL